MITEHVRVGYISAIHWEDGTVDIVYKGLDDSVTTDVPFPLLFCSKLKVDDPVWVLHRKAGRSSALCLGRYWFNDYRPVEGLRGLFRLAFSRDQERAYIRYTDPDEDDGGNDGAFLFHNDDDARAEAKNIELEADEDISLQAQNIAAEAKQKLSCKANTVVIEADTTGEIKAGATLELNAPSVKIAGDSIEISATATITIDSPQGKISFAAGDMVAAMVSLANHPHLTFALANAGGPVEGIIGAPTPTGG